jgi:hypothetical protein
VSAGLSATLTPACALGNLVSLEKRQWPVQPALAAADVMG